MSLLQFVLINLNLIAFFGLFLLLANGKRNLHFNRFYLLIMPIIAIVLPFIYFPQGTSEAVWTTELPAVTVMSDRSFIGEESWNYELLIYAIGALVFLGLLGFQLYLLLKPKKATLLKNYKGSPVYLLQNNQTSHSFFNRIYLNPNHLDNEALILVHEREHCRGLHSIDLMITACYKALFWFNPVVYLWHKKVQENHEFIADQKVMEENVSAADYGRILLSINFEGKVPQLVNTFNTKSMLRKRIENLNLKNQYPMKQLFILPVIAGMTFFSMGMQNQNNQDDNGRANYEKTRGEFEKKKAAHGEPDEKAQFKGGQEGMMNFMSKEVKYPKSLLEKGPTGIVYVKFNISTSGEVQDAEIARSSSFDAMDKEAIRVVEKMPNWIPAKKDGAGVKTQITLPFKFTITD